MTTLIISDGSRDFQREMQRGAVRDETMQFPPLAKIVTAESAITNDAPYGVPDLDKKRSDVLNQRNKQC